MPQISHLRMCLALLIYTVSTNQAIIVKLAAVNESVIFSAILDSDHRQEIILHWNCMKTSLEYGDSSKWYESPKTTPSNSLDDAQTNDLILADFDVHVYVAISWSICQTAKLSSNTVPSWYTKNKMLLRYALIIIIVNFIEDAPFKNSGNINSVDLHCQVLYFLMNFQSTKR